MSKYLSIETVSNAYRANADKTKNKFWGLLGVLKAIDQTVVPGRTYTFSAQRLSLFLENLFCLETPKTNYGDSVMSALFSNVWSDKVSEQMLSLTNKANIYDIATWFYRKERFNDDYTEDNLIEDFCNSTHLSQDILNKWFSFSKKKVSFTSRLYDDDDLLSKLKPGLPRINKNITAENEVIKSHPGELSRAPFFQTLYSSQQTTECLLLTQFDINTLYSLESADTKRTTIAPKIKYRTTLGVFDKEGTKALISALRTKPFLLLAGISGTGKSRLVRELAFQTCPSYLQDKDGTTPGNYLMVEVKPNWHDSSELLGYYSNISKKYIFTSFVKFLIKAKHFPNIPFFVCLDEMNLAHVEQYFAEFLSVLETRKRTEENGIKTSPLVNKDAFQEIYEMDGDKKKVLNKKPSDEDWYKYLCTNKEIVSSEIDTTGEIELDFNAYYTLMKEGLTLPENVFVIGTVNMDDTTHQFSRKVIDRAFTIEMNGGDLSNVFGGSKQLKYSEKADDELPNMFNTYKNNYVTADEVIEKCDRVKSDAELQQFIIGLDEKGNKVKDSLPAMLDGINEVLENTPFQVSYRVFNELVIYFGVLLDMADEDKDYRELAKEALDKVTVMKILPRIEGDADMFDYPTARTENGKEVNNKLENLMTLFAEGTESAKKLDEMNKRMTATGFTRFWP